MSPEKRIVRRELAARFQAALVAGSAGVPHAHPSNSPDDAAALAVRHADALLFWLDQPIEYAPRKKRTPK